MNIMEFMTHCNENNIASIARKVEKSNERIVISFIPDNYLLHEGKDEIKPSITMSINNNSKEKEDLNHNELLDLDIRKVTDENYDFVVSLSNENEYLVSLTQKRIGNQNIRHEIFKDLVFKAELKN